MRVLQLVACTAGYCSCHGNRERAYHYTSMTAALGKLTVQDEQGRPVEVSSLWRDKTIVLAFVRHFG